MHQTPRSEARDSEAFREFLRENGIQAEAYGSSPPRYLRLRDRDTTLIDLRRVFGNDVKPVPWLSGFYELPGHIKIRTSDLFERGSITGIDAASGFIVRALSLEPHHQVLDLCCAPGAKTSMIADSLTTGVCTGVDIARGRLASAKSLLRKHHTINVRLFLEDGTAFRGGAVRSRELALLRRARGEPGVAIPSVQHIGRCDRGAAPFWAPKVLRSPLYMAEESYDRVLVDVECSHDGHMYHSTKFGADVVQKKMLSKEKMESLPELQKSLLKNGFRHLKPGGVLVYSTCSLADDQNEGVVSRFLSEYGRARLDAFPQHEDCPGEFSEDRAMVRFIPAKSRTKGLFCARICKSVSG